MSIQSWLKKIHKEIKEVRRGEKTILLCLFDLLISLFKST